jgi:hypothetical protein
MKVYSLPKIYALVYWSTVHSSNNSVHFEECEHNSVFLNVEDIFDIYFKSAMI